MSTNGNGKVSAAVAAAVKRVEDTRAPLAHCDHAIVIATAKVVAAQDAVAAANLVHNMASQAYAEDDSPTNRKNLLYIAEEVKLGAVKLADAEKKLAALQTQRQGLDAEFQKCTVVLIHAQRDARLAELDNLITNDKIQLITAQNAVAELQHRINMNANERITITRGMQDEQWRLYKPRMDAQFNRTNAGNPALREPTVRNSW